ncbi:MAG: PaaI family thioesterase [Paludibacteraceae bacterium]|nr:PaaI family thioesterase [Paludibacteraceae bacterium]MBP6284123.1 PaaI family thioesterase [Paludibacteraceae bacterium]
MKDHIYNDQFAKHVGIQIVEAAYGLAIAKMIITDIHLNGLGIVHGGALFTLADLTLGAAVNSLGGEHVTMNASVNYLKAATKGTLIGTAKKLSVGRTIASYDIEIRLEETTELIAVFRGTSFKKS